MKNAKATLGLSALRPPTSLGLILPAPGKGPPTEEKYLPFPFHTEPEDAVEGPAPAGNIEEFIRLSILSKLTPPLAWFGTP